MVIAIIELLRYVEFARGGRLRNCEMLSRIDVSSLCGSVVSESFLRLPFLGDSTKGTDSESLTVFLFSGAFGGRPRLRFGGDSTEGTESDFVIVFLFFDPFGRPRPRLIGGRSITVLSLQSRLNGSASG